MSRPLPIVQVRLVPGLKVEIPWGIFLQHLLSVYRIKVISCAMLHFCST